MKTILVPIDFSDITGKVVDMAVSLATAFGSRVILVHVVEPEPQFVGYDPGPLSVGVSIPGDPEADRRRLDEIRKKFGSTDVLPINTQGSIPDEILDLAREHSADLIVIGSHGHGALYHLIVGSVANAILKQAQCPVLIVPSGHRAPAGACRGASGRVGAPAGA